MAKLADAPDLGSGSERSEGSSPFIRTKMVLFVIWAERQRQGFQPLFHSKSPQRERTKIDRTFRCFVEQASCLLLIIFSTVG